MFSPRNKKKLYLINLCYPSLSGALKFAVHETIAGV